MNGVRNGVTNGVRRSVQNQNQNQSLYVSGFLLCGQDQIQVTVTYPDALGLDQRR